MVRCAECATLDNHRLGAGISCVLLCGACVWFHDAEVLIKMRVVDVHVAARGAILDRLFASVFENVSLVYVVPSRATSRGDTFCLTAGTSMRTFFFVAVIRLGACKHIHVGPMKPHHTLNCQCLCFDVLECFSHLHGGG